MTTSSVNGSGNGARSGAQTLALLATPLNHRLLHALAEGPRRQSELRQEIGTPAQTTLRAHLNELIEIGSIEKHRRNRFPGVLDFELTAAGRDLMVVVASLERWLEQAPGGSLELGTPEGRSAIKALTGGWSTTIIRALAARPLLLVELDRIISSLSYPALERRMGAMRVAGQIEAQPGDGGGTPYAVTPWLRRGVAPIVSAMRWERRHLSSQALCWARIDVEATFLLAVPLLYLPADSSGSCRMTVLLPNGNHPQLAGVLIDVKDGRVVSYETRLRGSPDAWASGSIDAWLAAFIENDFDNLELGGASRLVSTFLHSLHDSFFGARTANSDLGLDAENLIRDDGSNQTL